MNDPDETVEEESPASPEQTEHAEQSEQTELDVAQSGQQDGTLEPAVMARLEHVIEALLLASDSPLSVEQIHRLLGAELDVNKTHLRAALEQLGERISKGACELKEVSSGYRIHVKSDYAEWVGRLWQEKPPRYSRALLETLALVCYRQPITRGEIEDIRGVAVSTNILRTLSERGWIRELGVKEVPGRPMLFGTTHQFLDDFNLRSLDELPTLPEIKDADQLDAALARLQETGNEIQPAPLSEEDDETGSEAAGQGDETPGENVVDDEPLSASENVAERSEEIEAADEQESQSVPDEGEDQDKTDPPIVH